MEQFRKLGLTEETIKVLKDRGFTKPTLIQEKAIPILLEGKKDIIGQSQTGTGKTASFALPIIEKFERKGKNISAIILIPTRELAIQLTQEINLLKGNRDVKVLSVYGGAPLDPQIEKLKRGIDIVVGTPGRVMDLQKRNYLKINNVRYVVLDEADEMLNMGFVDDIESILRSTPKEKSMLLFSATMPKPILNIAKKYMRNYELIEIKKSQVVTDNIEQIYYQLDARDRMDALRRIIDYYPNFYGIIFCNTKATVDTLTSQLIKFNYRASSLHGDITQNQREKILKQFKNKEIKILVATDVAARGIDINDLTHVINFSLPQSPESYVHRIGRTARAGKKGISITFVIPSERRKLNYVERVNNCKLFKRKLPSISEIIEHKENMIKLIIKELIDKKKSDVSKYDLMSDELLKEYDAKKVVSAVLKYSFKNELDSNTYKNITESTDTGENYRNGNRKSNGRFGGRSRVRSNSSSGRFSDRRSRSDSSTSSNGRFSDRRSRSDSSTSSNGRFSDRRSRSDSSNFKSKDSFSSSGKRFKDRKPRNDRSGSKSRN